MNNNPISPSAPEDAQGARPAGENALARRDCQPPDATGLFRALFEQTAVGIAQIEAATGRFVWINQRYCDIVGYSREEMEKLDFQSITHPDDLAADGENMRRLVNGEVRGFTGEKRCCRKDGSSVWVNLTVSPLWQPGETPSFTLAMVEDISERKRAEVALRESKTLYQSLVEQLPQSVFRKDRAGRFTFGNHRFCEQLERSLSEVLGKTDLDLFPVELAEKYRQDDRHIMETGQVWSGIERHRSRGGGAEIFVEVTKSPLYDATGKIVGIQGIFWDVTDRHRAAEALRASEARLNEAERLAHLGSWETELVSLEDSSQNPLSWSAETFRIFGFEPGAVAATRELFSHGIHPEDRAKVREAAQAALRERKPYSTEHRIVRPGGSERIVLEQAELVCDATTGRPRKFIGTVQDITERRRLLRQIEGVSRMREFLLGPGDLPNKLRCITDALVAVFEADFARIWITLPGDLCRIGCIHAQATEGPHVCRFRDRCLHLLSSSGRYTHTDGTGHRRVPFGAYKIGQVAAGDALKFITNDVVNDSRVHDHAWAKELGLVAFAGYRLISEQGEPIGVLALFSKLAISPGEDSLLEQVATTASQVIQALKTEEARMHLEAQLRQAQKMEAIGRLAGGVAHDFNNMLQVILGNVDFALDKVQSGDSLRECLEEIRQSARRSADLTRQLLAFARKQTISPKVLDLNDTVASMLKMLQRLIGEDIRLLWSPGAGLWPIRIDPSQIDQILANLTVNARDAIEGIGQMTIETANMAMDDTYAFSHPECGSGDYVVLIVSDTGRGMDEETRTHLFEPFFTTKDRGKGTGLGLATVFGIVKQNDGFINVYSEPGQGTVFKLYFPRAEVEAVLLAQPVAVRSLRGTETVLLVEDEELILNLGRRILERHGYTVLAASTPEAAMALAAQHPGLIHLLITDVVMPGMDGKELKQRLVAQQPGLKCLFMSGYTADVITHHGLLDEGVNFLQKPFTIQALAERVREVLEATTV